MVAVAAVVVEVAVAAAKDTRPMYVCTACKGVYYAPVNGVCPGCKGPMKQQDVKFDASGVAHVETD